MRMRRDKTGDVVGRPSWRSSFLGDPGAKFPCGKLAIGTKKEKRSKKKEKPVGTVGGSKSSTGGTNGLEERKDAVLSTLPQDVAKDLRAKNSTAEVLVHPDNGHVLVSNRGHDSIAVFKVNADSTTPIGHITSAGDREIRTPRNFNIDPTGKWILIASLDGGTVQVAQWADGNGKLTGSKAMVKKPMCVKFLAKP